jgi:hypothetical protein
VHFKPRRGIAAGCVVLVAWDVPSARNIASQEPAIRWRVNPCMFPAGRCRGRGASCKAGAGAARASGKVTIGSLKGAGGVLVDTRAGILILGQDLEAGYSSQDGVHYHLYVSESIVLRIDEPKAICVITAQG